MAQATVKVLVDDLDGAAAADTVRIGWNGDWRELDLSKKNLTSLSRVLDKYWNAGRPITNSAGARSRNGAKTTAKARTPKASRDPKVIRAWATEQGLAVPARGRIPAGVEQQYTEAHKKKWLPPSASLIPHRAELLTPRVRGPSPSRRQLGRWSELRLRPHIENTVIPVAGRVGVDD